MNKRPAQRRLFHVLMLSLVIMLAGGGVALLYQWHQGSTSSYASSDTVVGPPSLPASYVDSIFKRVGSPMVGTGQAVESASRQYNIDDAFALAVWWTETNDGAAGVGLADRNPGSVRGSTGYPSAYDGYTIYPSYTAAVNYWFYMLKKVYINRGLTTVSSISHPYVGTSTSDLWAGKVIALMQRYRGEAPPVPTPTPTIPPDLKRQGQQLSQDLKQQASGKNTYYPPAPATPQVATSAHASLNGPTQTLVVLLNLALALALALYAWNSNRQLARSPQPVPVTPVALSPWEQMRVSGQQPASFFNGFSGPVRTVNNVPGLRTTDSLLPEAVDTRTTESLAASFAVRTNSEALFSLGAFQPETAYLPSRQNYQPIWGDASTDAPLPAGQQAFPASPFASNQFSSFDTFAGAQQAFPGETFAGQQQAFPVPTTGYATTTPMLRPPLAGLSRPAQNSQPLYPGEYAQPQPQPVGTGSGGLLSRYRAQRGQE